LATKGLPPDVGVEIAGASILACPARISPELADRRGEQGVCGLSSHLTDQLAPISQREWGLIARHEDKQSLSSLEADHADARVWATVDNIGAINSRGVGVGSAVVFDRNCIDGDGFTGSSTTLIVVARSRYSSSTEGFRI
jgi:hypothetical protein